MVVKIKTFALVTLIASLIWIWAEGESFSSVVVNPRVLFVVDQTDLEFTPDETWRGTVRLRLEGSTVAIKQAERSLGSSIRLKPGQQGVPAVPGDRQAVNLIEAIRSLPDVVTMGLTVVDVDPPDAVVSVVRFVNREVTVRPQFPLDTELAGEPTVSPGRVVVRMPESLAARLTEADAATVPVTAQDLRQAREDGPQTISAPIQLPDKLAGVRGVEMITERTSVTFRLKKNVDSFTLPSVPVWVAVPPTESASWNIVVRDPFLRDVKFTGPVELIRKLRDRTIVPIAEVRLSSDELEAGAESKEAAVLGLPAGLEYTVGSNVVRLTITRRETPTPPEGGPSPLPEIKPEHN